MKELILLRGLPGAGKSTLADVILLWPSTDPSNALSADQYFEDEKGNYNFDASKLKEAHSWCKNQCERQMKLGYMRIVVANIFTQGWEMEDYYKLAEQYDYRVHSVIVENRHEGKNMHGVPEEHLERMKDRFEIKL
jgi:predicted kinase